MVEFHKAHNRALTSNHSKHNDNNYYSMKDY